MTESGHAPLFVRARCARLRGQIPSSLSLSSLILLGIDSPGGTSSTAALMASVRLFPCRRSARPVATNAAPKRLTVILRMAPSSR